MTEPLQLFLVEDDDDIALLIRRSLERAGHQVTSCRTGADAVIVLSHTSFNLVILDHLLVDMNSLNLLQILNREGIQVPVLIITAEGDEEVATQVLQAGALDYVVKDPALTFLVDLPKRITESVNRHRLQDLNRLLIQALESTRDGVMITDVLGEILHVNQALEGMTGYDRAEMLGQQPRLFRSGLHPSEYYAEMWRTILSRRSWQGELINRRKDGTLLDVSLTVSPVFDSREQMTHFVGIYRDIRERKQLERQLLQAQKMQSVGTLAGGIAHEFNNLLAGIQGYAALGIREPGLSPQTREFLQYIVELTDRAAGLTRQLLAFARKPALSRQPTGIAEMLQNTVELVRHSVCMEVELQLPEESPDQPLMVSADVNQLQQVLINLALNARDAIRAREQELQDKPHAQTTGLPGRNPPDEVPAHDGPLPRGKSPICFRLRHERLEGERIAFPEHVLPGDYVVLEVQDNGIGMTPEVLNQAFDPFFTTKGVGQGTGLGLPVAFGIIRGHQGYLTVDTSPRQGTRATIYLPRLAAVDDPVSRSFEEGEVLEPERMVGRNILVVDDELAVLDVIRRFLVIAGHQVTCASSGKEALELIRAGMNPDLVILDLMIPHEEGTKNFRMFKELRPNAPILLCTGLLQAESPFAALMNDAAGVLRKPFRMAELWLAVHGVFGTSH
jgi:PAS domain S-box-containing protein